MPIGGNLFNFGTDQNTMRCVVNELGKLVFASPAFGWNLGTCSSLLAEKEIDNLISIVSSYDSSYTPKDFLEADSGLYEVALQRKDRDPLIIQARVDLIKTVDNKKYKVVWLDPDNKLKSAKPSDMVAKSETFATTVIQQKYNIDKIEEIKAKAPANEGDAVFAISEKEGDYNHFVDLTNDMQAVYSRKGEFLRANKYFNMALGYSDIELKNFSFIELIYPEDRPQVISAISQLYKGDGRENIKITFDSRVPNKMGDVHFVEWIYKVAGNNVYIMGRNITDVKKHEEEVKQREQQLADAQKIGRMGHWSLDLDTDQMEWSDQIYSIFGKNKNIFTPTVARVSKLLVSEDRNNIYRAFHKAKNSKGEYSLSFRVAGKDGAVTYIYCEGRCKINALTGSVEALYGIMQDVTESKLKEQALNAAKDAAETAYASKTRFLANMSHELRTPLNAIIGFSEMMQQQLIGPLGNNRYLDYVGSIHQSGQHLLDLINDMLDMSKMEIGKYEIDPEELNISKLIRLAVHMVEGHAQDNGVRLITDRIFDDLKICADRRAMMQILLNILSNAIKFTPDGGEVEIACTQLGRNVEILVSDTGIGIPADKIDIVTKPFEQVRDQYVRDHKGSGLGLAITKDLVELHGGKLTIASTLGEGTSVFVSVPQNMEALVQEQDSFVIQSFRQSFNMIKGDKTKVSSAVSA